MRDEIDERLYCNGPPESTSTMPKDVPSSTMMQKVPLHIDIISHTPTNKYQLQYVPRDAEELNYSSGGKAGMYWDMDSRPFASVERYRNWLETGIVESDHERQRRENNEFMVKEYHSNKPTSISGCAKDNWFWIMVGISATLITLVISNNELAWLPEEMWVEYAAGGVFYVIYGLAHLAPLFMLFLGGWGILSYCSTISCDRDHFTIVMSMILVTAGILIFYAVLNQHQPGGWEEMWELKDRMVAHALENK